jgi:hypothetical protein
MFEVMDTNLRKTNTLSRVLPTCIVHGSNRMATICKYVFRVYTTHLFDY